MKQRVGFSRITPMHKDTIHEVHCIGVFFDDEWIGNIVSHGKRDEPWVLRINTQVPWVAAFLIHETGQEFALNTHNAYRARSVVRRWIMRRYQDAQEQELQ